MALDQPYPELDEFLAAIGVAGRRISEIAASERADDRRGRCLAAGNKQCRPARP